MKTSQPHSKAPAFLAAAALFLCSCNSEHGTVQVTQPQVSSAGSGRIFGEDGKPVADAEIHVVPVGYLPQASLAKASADIYKLKTDAEGAFSVKGLPSGQYNIIAAKGDLASLQDSVTLFGDSTALPPDTLRTAGSVRGVVTLEPNHNPSTVTLQLLGTTVFANLDDQGRFEIGGLPQGRYAARFSTILPEYTNLFTGFAVQIGGVTDIKEPFRMNFIGIPVVTGLQVAMMDTLNSRVKITWNPSRRTDLLGYAVLRDPFNTQRIQGQPINPSRITDTQYVDTLSPSLSVGTLGQAWEYRVIGQAKNGKYGEWFESVGVNVPPPSAVMTSVNLTPMSLTLRLGESGKIIAVFSNPNRKISAVTWMAKGIRFGKDTTSAVSLPYTDTLKTKRYAAPPSSGTDTLRYTAGLKPESVSLVCVTTDDAGMEWPADIYIGVVLNPPVVQVSPDTTVVPGTVLHLRAKGTDMYGKAAKLAWDIGGTGVFVPSTHGDTDVTVSNQGFKSFPCILRVTDEYGSLILKTVSVNILPFRQLPSRPVHPRDWLPLGESQPYMATLGGVIYVLGGRGTAAVGAFTAYDTSSKTWQVKATADTAAPLYALNGRLYMPTRNALKVYDPIADEWVVAPPPPAPTLPGDRFTAVVFQDKLYIVAGANRATKVAGVTQAFDPAIGSWSTYDSAPWFEGSLMYYDLAPLWNGLPTDLIVTKDRILGVYCNWQVASFDPETGMWSLGSKLWSSVWGRFKPLPLLPDGGARVWENNQEFFVDASGINESWMWNLPVRRGEFGYTIEFQSISGSTFSLYLDPQTGFLQIEREPGSSYDIYQPVSMHHVTGDHFASITLGSSIFILTYTAVATPGSPDLPAFYQYSPLD